MSGSESTCAQGVAYYPDYIYGTELLRNSDGSYGVASVEEHIRSDFLRMKAIGIGLIRIGEFSWSTVKSSKSSGYDFSLFQLVLDLALEFKLGVWLCTPTATPPKWLIDEFPEILPQTEFATRVHFGSRRHYDPTNKNFRAAVREVVREFARNLGKHPAVCGWQIDNELGHHGSAKLYTKSAEERFRNWLQQRYECVAKLNQSWFTRFWSQGYSCFSQIELPRATFADHNPHLLLDFNRFCSDVFKEFLEEQVSVLRESVKSSVPVTHNFNSSPYNNDICPWQLSGSLDIAGFDHYQEGYNPEPARSLLHFTFMRSLKQKRFLVLEQQPVQVNWQEVNKRFSYDWLYLWAMQSFVLGAEAVFYFSWKRFLGGAEQYHDGIVGHDVRVAKSKQEWVLEAISESIGGLGPAGQLRSQPRIDALIVHNTESLWTHEICSQSSRYKPLGEVQRCCELLSSLGLGFEFAADLGNSFDKTRYSLVMIPGYSFVFDDQERQNLQEFLDAGGKVISFPRTGMKHKNNYMSQQPLSLFEPDEFSFYDYGALGVEESVDIFIKGKNFRGEIWLEDLRIHKNWEPLGEFIDDMYSGPAAIKRNFPASGGLYIHCAFIPVLTAEFKEWFCSELNLENTGVDCENSPGVQIIPYEGYDYILNFSTESVRFRARRSPEEVKIFMLDKNLKVDISTLKNDSMLPARCLAVCRYR